MAKIDIDQIRKEYTKHALDESDVRLDPIDQFNKWFEQAMNSEVAEPNAMSLATVDQNGNPAVRIVLLKGIERNGFRFFTNYASDKGRQIEHNSNVALCFFWVELERQVRINGTVEKLSREESKTYFDTRPYASQIGALASDQSAIVTDRKKLDTRFIELRNLYPEGEVPMPETWGGYSVKPHYFEFWQGRRSRLHDRIVYEKKGSDWNIKRLSP